MEALVLFNEILLFSFGKVLWITDVVMTPSEKQQHAFHFSMKML